MKRRKAGGAPRVTAATGPGLVVHRDAAGRVHLLTLARPLFEHEWQNQVAAAAANTANAYLSAAQTEAQAAALGRNAMAATSTLGDGALARSPQRPPACAPGCAHCCHQAVGVSPPEVLAIHAHLRATRTPEALAATLDRLRAADDRTRGLTPAQRLSPEHPCPFLDDARCTIYQVRPLACRGSNSLDAAACDRALHDPAARQAFLDGSVPIPCYVEPIRAFHAVAAGMQLALAELHELQMQPLELTAAMRLLADAPDLAARWLAGEDAFAPARGGGSIDDPRGRALAGAAPATPRR